jgi:hypothetical protein
MTEAFSSVVRVFYGLYITQTQTLHINPPHKPSTQTQYRNPKPAGLKPAYIMNKPVLPFTVMLNGAWSRFEFLSPWLERGLLLLFVLLMAKAMMVDPPGTARWLSLAGSMVSLGLIGYFSYRFRPRFIRVTPEGIDGQPDGRSPLSLMWAEVTDITFEGRLITIRLKNGNEEEIDLFTRSYKTFRDAKEIITEEAGERDIPVFEKEVRDERLN